MFCSYSESVLDCDMQRENDPSTVQLTLERDVCYSNSLMCMEDIIIHNS